MQSQPITLVRPAKPIEASTPQRWRVEAIEELFKLPFSDLLFRAQQVHREHFDPNAVQLSTLLSIKTGGCSEDCGYCPQSAFHDAGVENRKMLEVQEVIKAAKAAQSAGADRFCMGAAWREPSREDMAAVVEMVKEVKALGMETCATLGMLNDEQTEQLRQAGLDYYNHNLDTAPEFYGDIISTRDYQDRIDTLERVRKAGMHVCSGGIVGIDDTVSEAAPKMVLRVMQSKAALLGVAQSDIVDAVQIALSGQDVTALHALDAKYAPPLRLGLAAEKRSRIDDVLKLKVRSRDGALVPLSEVVQVVKTERDYPIYHKDLLPVVYVTGDMAGDLDSPLYGMFDINGKTGGMALEQGGTLAPYFFRQPSDPYAAYALKWDGEWQVTFETFRDMGIAYGVGLILIYLLVVAQFKSYVVPLVIMAPIPLTIIGVMPGHALFGAQFTATSMIGMIALAGIIVRNSILLVDFVNLQLRDGVDLQHAVVNAAAARAKPILLTGLAAMLGALFILDDPIFNGLALALIFGILVSTVLTLIVIPVLYYATLYKKFP